MSAPRPRPGEPGWAGPEWDDPVLTALAHRLRDAHRLVAPLPADDRRRLIRHLLIITDLAKRDPQLADRRLVTFVADLEREHGSSYPPDGGEARELRRRPDGGSGGPGEGGRTAE
ncbi:hypothetical protein [Actinomadura alba]|uniref:hypothetical protein n=1 Tax=Actinomadura alba TaxID=406431 RepID=UPI001C9BD051|nr:hypothetical protein [Actinomadura alba]